MKYFQEQQRMKIRAHVQKLQLKYLLNIHICILAIYSFPVHVETRLNILNIHYYTHSCHINLSPMEHK